MQNHKPITINRIGIDMLQKTVHEERPMQVTSAGYLLYAALVILPILAWGCGQDGSGGLKNDIIIFGGDIVTMAPLGDTVEAVEAVWVKDGKIAAVGAAADILENKSAETVIVDLAGGALLPGFIEPHIHIQQLAVTDYFFADLDPCLPTRYETREECSAPDHSKGDPLDPDLIECVPQDLETRKQCSTTITGALDMLPEKRDPHWILGDGLDPSRTTLAGESGPEGDEMFHNNPARYIEEYVQTDDAVLKARSG